MQLEKFPMVFSRVSSSVICFETEPWTVVPGWAAWSFIIPLSPPPPRYVNMICNMVCSLIMCLHVHMNMCKCMCVCVCVCVCMYIYPTHTYICIFKFIFYLFFVSLHVAHPPLWSGIWASSPDVSHLCTDIPSSLVYLVCAPSHQCQFFFVPCVKTSRLSSHFYQGMSGSYLCWGSLTSPFAQLLSPESCIPVFSSEHVVSGISFVFSVLFCARELATSQSMYISLSPDRLHILLWPANTPRTRKHWWTRQ